MKDNKTTKNEALLWFGSWTSKIGNIIFDYANTIRIVGAFSTKPWVLALYQSSETIIQIIFNLIGGAKADSGSRKRLLILTDLISAFFCFVLYFFIETVYMATVMVITNALLALVYAFNSPTYKSIVREVIEKDRIGFYNSISHIGSELIGIAGPIIGVGLVSLIGTRGALLFDAATFVISAVSEFFLEKLHNTAPSRKKDTHVLHDILEGFRYLIKEKQILFLVILSSLVNFFLAGYNLLLPYTNITVTEQFYSKALAMEAVGGIVYSVISAKMFNRFRDSVKMMILFLFGTGFVLILEPILTLLHNDILCLIPLLLFGMFLTGFNIQFMSHVQISAAETYLGRVFSIIFTVAVLFMPLGSFFFSALTNVQDIKSFYLVGGGIASLASVSYLIYRVQNTKHHT